MPTVRIPVAAGLDQGAKLRSLIAQAKKAGCVNVCTWPPYKDGRKDVFLIVERAPTSPKPMRRRSPTILKA